MFLVYNTLKYSKWAASNEFYVDGGKLSLPFVEKKS